MREITKIVQLPQQIPRRKRVAAYCRVSDDKDAMLKSLSAQIGHYSAYIQRRRDWEYVGVYADEAKTGTKGARPEFQRLINDCKNGGIDLVLTKSIARFARNTLTMLEVVRELKTLGIDVYFENERIHSMSGDGELMLSILASYAQEESRSVSENCKWRIKKMFEKGIPNGDNMLGYRLIDGTYHIVPEEAETIKTIFNDFLSGVGRMAIVKKLTESGAKTRRGGNWCENGIMRILKNEKYTGDMLLQKTYIADHISKESRYNKGERLMYLIGNSHEAIIDKDIFQAVQREIAARAARYHPSKAAPKSYPFTGKIICGLCGNRYRRKIAGAGGKYQKAVWICDTFNRHGKAACSSKQIPEDILLSTTAAALGLTEFSADIFKARVSEIRVTGANQLLFIFHDGTQTETTWADRSRRDSWNDEMKQTARARQYEMMKGRANK